VSRFVGVFLTKRSRWLAAVPVAIVGIVFAMSASIFAATATSPEYIMGPILSHNYVAYSEVDTPGSGYDTVEANTPSVDNAPQVQSSAEPTFPTNANGQTYGSSMGLPPSESPVLVAVQDTVGQTGYVYARQLYGGWYGQVPTTPQQAVALNSSGPDTIPVYESNGTTVIGQFVVGQNVTVSLAATPAPTGMTAVHVF